MALKDNTPRGSSSGKTRNWELIVYPESCSNVLEIVEELGKECDFLLSPLHDKDVTKDGETKKPHYHLYVFYSGNKSFKQRILKVSSDSEALSGRFHLRSK